MNECDALYIDALAEYRPNHDVATYVLPPAERVNIFKKYKFEMLAKYYTVIIIWKFLYHEYSDIYFFLSLIKQHYTLCSIISDRILT